MSTHAKVVGVSAALFALCCVGHAHAQQQRPEVNLTTSKRLLLPVPGEPRRVNSLPQALAVSPDGRWVVAINAGYATKESNYMQSLAVMNAATGEVKDFPEPRTLVTEHNTFFSGLAFSPDGTKLYVSLASTIDPEGNGKDTGNGVIVYGFAGGAPKAQGFFKLPLVKLAAGRTSTLSTNGGRGLAPFPAAIAVVPGEHTRLLIAENLSDSVVLMNAETGAIEHTFDVSEDTQVPAVYPISVAVSRDGRRGFVALWNGSEVQELDLVDGALGSKVALLKPNSPTDPGTHPCALLLDERAGLLWVALSNRDVVAGVEIGKAGKPELTVRGYFDTRLPGQSYFGAEPDALAMNSEGTRLYAANLGSDAIAVIDPRKLRTVEKAKGMTEPMGFVPTEEMPMALAFDGGKLYVANGRGKGTGPNNAPQPQTSSVAHIRNMHRPFTYAPTIDYGSLARLDEKEIDGDLKSMTDEVLNSNLMKSGKESIEFVGGGQRIKHVIYIIKENRTYDQIFGDLEKDGKRVANGDPSLTMYGAQVTPNLHKLVLQYGVLDNFYDSGEVSGEGHVWSTAGIGTDYLERTWQINYRGGGRTYDYEGVVANGVPLNQHIPDVAEPSSAYLWTNFAAHGKTVYHFAEYVRTTFCGRNDEMGKPLPKQEANPQQGVMTGGEAACAHPFIRQGDPIPAEWGGGVSKWPWPIPRIEKNTPTKPELVGHFAPESPDFNLRVPDQFRVNVFLRHLSKWVKDREAGNDDMPNYIMLRLSNDHTAGTVPGGPTPKSSVADNDLAVGRAVEAISHSPYWDDTAFFILEDDAQNGADHVDAHRSLGVVVSKYAPHPQPGQEAFVDSHFYSTVSFLRTMEELLGVPPMNNNDAFASPVASLFTGPGDQPPFTADTSNRDNGLIYTANKKDAVGAEASLKMDFTHADRAPVEKLNLILWQDAMGVNTPPPAMILMKSKHKDDDDD